VKSRIVLTPQMPKEIYKSNGEDIHRFELAHGEIKDTEQPPIPFKSSLTRYFTKAFCK
jgi:hypothetical protein